MFQMDAKQEQALLSLSETCRNSYYLFELQGLALVSWKENPISVLIDLFDFVEENVLIEIGFSYNFLPLVRLFLEFFQIF